VTIGQWFASEVAAPLGADFFIGLPESEEHRVSPVIPPPPIDLADFNPSEMAIRAGSNPFPDPELANQRWSRAAEIPAGNGQGNARSVALVQAGCDRAFDEQISGTDLVLGYDLRFGMGYGLSSALMPFGPRTCYWGGMGGSLIIMDQDVGMTICYAMNRMGDAVLGDLRGFGLVAAAVAGLAGG
jgi:CubicO group peptidase (beta-lactamase class C family)